MFINGDLAFISGTKHDYAAVLGLLRPLREEGSPIHLAMGNHDDRENFWKVLRASKTVQPSLPGRQATIVRAPKANWFVLDSLIHTQTTPGRLGEAQRAWLAGALDANTDKPALILIHHQPALLVGGKTGSGAKEAAELFAMMAGGRNGSGSEDAAELLAILRPRRQVKAWFFGHTHRWGVYQDESGIHLVNLPPTAYLFDEGRPNGWLMRRCRTAARGWNCGACIARTNMMGRWLTWSGAKFSALVAEFSCQGFARVAESPCSLKTANVCSL